MLRDIYRVLSKGEPYQDIGADAVYQLLFKKERADDDKDA